MYFFSYWIAALLNFLRSPIQTVKSSYQTFHVLMDSKELGIHEISPLDFNEIFVMKHLTNPANGLPMISGDTSGWDVAGNLFGTDNSQLTQSMFDHHSSVFDSMNTETSMFGGNGFSDL